MNPTTPKANTDFNRELKRVIQERNMLTTRTKKCVFDALDEIEQETLLESTLRKKENAIFEIVLSEKTYVQQLLTLIKFFIKPIQEKKLLKPLEFEILFGNIQTIYNVNEQLLQELYLGSLNIGNAFSKIAPFFKLYSSYAMQFKNSIRLLHTSRIKNREFYKFVEQQETRPEVQSKLSALLITPIQRIPRYKLLLQQLVDLTSPSEKNFDALLDSLHKVTEAAAHVNNVIEEQEHMQRLLEVQRCLKNGEPNLIVPGRRLIKEGELSKFTTKEAHHEKLYIVLTSDIILFCKMKSSNLKSNSLKSHIIFPLNKCRVTEALDKGCLQITCQNEEIVLYHKELDVTKDWINILTASILEIVEDRKTLKKESSARRPVKRKDLKEYNDVGLSPGKPLRKRRKTIEEEITKKPWAVSPRRSLRGCSAPKDIRVFSPLTITLKPKQESETIPKPVPNVEESLPQIQENEGVSKDVFVFGGNNHFNRSFSFKMGSLLNSLGSSVKNLFSFKRNN